MNITESPQHHDTTPTTHSHSTTLAEMEDPDLSDDAARLLTHLDRPQLSGLGLTPHDEARRLVRLVQCPVCSKPFTHPLILPCGRSICSACLSEPRLRSKVTYPNLPDRQREVDCNLGCGMTHNLADCSYDVVLGNVIKAIADVVESRNAAHSDSIATYTRRSSDISPTCAALAPARRVVVNSPRGRLVDTYNLATLGLLQHNADIAYSSSASPRRTTPTGSTTPQKEQLLPAPQLHIYESHTSSTRHIDDIVLDELFESTYKELDCQVCYSVFLDPVTTPCGHTYCRSCLIESLSLAPSCPACRRTIYLPPSLNTQPSNKTLSDFLMALCPDTISARARLAPAASAQSVGHYKTPLFVVSNAFPETPMFLRIFEPRYRLMLQRALSGDHTFGMISHNVFGTSQGDLGRTQFMEYGTLMRIEYSEMLEDGTSIVEARGISRFRVKSYEMTDNYYVANVERVEDVSLAEEERIEIAETTAPRIVANDPATMTTEDMLAYGLKFVWRMHIRSAPWFNTQLLTVHGEPPNDAALFPYWLASVLPLEEPITYQLLLTTSVRQRLKLAIGWIAHLEAQHSFTRSTGL